MDTAAITADTLQRSVIAVPPLARDAYGQISAAENAKIVEFLEAGGVSTLLYGGNAVLYHMAPSEYGGLLSMMTEVAAEETLMIPSVGPAYGVMMDQADVLREFDFPTAMVLPQQGVATSAGVATGIRHFVERFGKPAVVYIKFDGFLDVADVRRLVDDDLVSWIKYATVRENPAEDAYLKELVAEVHPSIIVSGIGEQPAIAHMREFGLASFTSGCVCVAPRLSMAMLEAIADEDYEQAESIRQTFAPLEDLRNTIHPIRVLHAAVELAGVAATGPIQPLLSPVDEEQAQRIAHAATTLRQSTPVG